ncbi:MAG TPA: hypothetical protein VMT30_07915 [Candidatus Saccharimonadia bacterium]|nr:hypothetical protein [Candidatus Saccharimonadia bacterium]
MKNVLALTAGLLAFASAFPYLVDVIRGKTHPNLVTWLTWTLVDVILFIAALSSGSVATTILMGGITLGAAAILVAGLRGGVKTYTPFDFACQAIALIGIVAWRITGNAITAVAISEIVVLVAALPTWRHAWLSPRAETWQGFAVAIASGIFTLASLSRYDFVSLVPVLVFIGNSAILCAIILGRRRYLAPPPSIPAQPA